MADSKNMSASEINRRMKREMDAARKKLREDGFSPMEIDQMMRDYFVQKKSPKRKTTMTAAKGGMAKMAKKKMMGGGMAKMTKKKKMMRGGMAKKKMRGGGMMKKKMMGGGMAKMAKKKKMMRGGMAKKKK